MSEYLTWKQAQVVAKRVNRIYGVEATIRRNGPGEGAVSFRDSAGNRRTLETVRQAARFTDYPYKYE